MYSITLQSICNQSNHKLPHSVQWVWQKKDKNPQELSTSGKFSFPYSDHRDLSNSVCLRDPSKDEELIYRGHTWSRRASVHHFWLEVGNMAWKIQNIGVVEREYWLVRRVSGNTVGTQTPEMQGLPLSSCSQCQSHTPAITFNISTSRELSSLSPSLLPLTIPCSCGTLRSVLWRV